MQQSNDFKNPVSLTIGAPPSNAGICLLMKFVRVWAGALSECWGVCSKSSLSEDDLVIMLTFKCANSLTWQFCFCKFTLQRYSHRRTKKSSIWCSSVRNHEKLETAPMFISWEVAIQVRVCAYNAIQCSHYTEWGRPINDLAGKDVGAD